MVEAKPGFPNRATMGTRVTTTVVAPGGLQVSCANEKATWVRSPSMSRGTVWPATAENVRHPAVVDPAHAMDREN